EFWQQNPQIKFEDNWALIPKPPTTRHEGIFVSRAYVLGLLPEGLRPNVEDKPRHAPKRDTVEAVAKKLWPGCDGKPPLEIIDTGEALRTLGDELQRLGIKASIDTQKRAIGRK